MKSKMSKQETNTIFQEKRESSSSIRNYHETSDMRPRVLFLNVIDQKKAVQKMYYPLAFGYLVSYAQKHGHMFPYSYSEALDKDTLCKFNPHVVAMTSITENYPLAIRYAQLIKETNPRVKVVIGGVHISAVPQSLSPSMDVGVVGEGEQTFSELSAQDFEPDDSIDGIVYHHPDGTLHETKRRSLIEPLDSLPHPDRSIFPMGTEFRPQYVFTSRGCSYRCKFCSSSRFWQKVRFHSPEYVAQELEDLRNVGIQDINIYDDLFIMDLERVKRIRDLVKPLGLRYSVAARANLVTEEVAAVLKDMNVTNVGIGFESNSQRILDLLGKGNKVEDNQRAINIIRKYGIHVTGSFIRDVPSETRTDIRKTYQFIKRNRLAHDMYRLMRFPNTPLYEGSTDWSKCEVKTCLPLTMRLRRMVSPYYHKIIKINP